MSEPRVSSEWAQSVVDAGGIDKLPGINLVTSMDVCADLLHARADLARVCLAALSNNADDAVASIRLMSERALEAEAELARVKAERDALAAQVAQLTEENNCVAVNCTTQLHRAQQAESQVAALRDALSEVNRIQSSDAVMAVYQIAQNVVGPYKGERWDKVVDAAMNRTAAAASAHDAAKIREGMERAAQVVNEVDADCQGVCYNAIRAAAQEPNDA